MERTTTLFIQKFGTREKKERRKELWISPLVSARYHHWSWRDFDYALFLLRGCKHLTYTATRFTRFVTFFIYLYLTEPPPHLTILGDAWSLFCTRWQPMVFPMRHSREVQYAVVLGPSWEQSYHDVATISWRFVYDFLRILHLAAVPGFFFFFCLGAFGATLILHDFFNDFVGSDSGFSSRFRVPWRRIRRSEFRRFCHQQHLGICI